MTTLDNKHCMHMKDYIHPALRADEPQVGTALQRELQHMRCNEVQRPLLYHGNASTCTVIVQRAGVQDRDACSR
jgi:hypothetical protein